MIANAMKNKPVKIKERVWIYPGEAAWHFVTIAKTDADEIKLQYIWPRRGFGAIPVNVKIGETSWKTSVFPDKNGTYLLPIKKEVRKKENILEKDLITISLEVIN